MLYYKLHQTVDVVHNMLYSKWVSKEIEWNIFLQWHASDHLTARLVVLLTRYLISIVLATQILSLSKISASSLIIFEAFAKLKMLLDFELHFANIRSC